MRSTHERSEHCTWKIFIQARSWKTEFELAFLTPDRSEAVETVLDTRRAGVPACGSAPANVLSEYVEETGGTRFAGRAVDAAVSAADWVLEIRARK